MVEVAYIGGGYLTIPANNPEDPFILACLLHAIFHLLDNEHRAFQSQAASVAVLGLWLSDNCVRAAGLQRNTRPVDTINGDIRWPHSKVSRTLENAVTFRLEDVETEMNNRGVGIEGLNSLSVRPDEASLNYSDPRLNPICRRPFLLVDSEIVVISPSTIVPAIRDALIDLAHASGLSQIIVDAYQQAVHIQVIEHADLQGWRHIGSDNVVRTTCTIRESLFQIDADKVAAIYLVCDDLRPSEKYSDGRSWDLDRTIPEVESRIASVEQDLLALEEPPREILHCLLVQGIGRHYMFWLPRSPNPLMPRIALTADDFGIFSLVNLNDSIALWQVARARSTATKLWNARWIFRSLCSL